MGSRVVRSRRDASVTRRRLTVRLKPTPAALENSREKASRLKATSSATSRSSIRSARWSVM